MTCSFHRWRITNAIENDAELNRKTAQHLFDCTECSAFFDEQIKLREMLRSKNNIIVQDPPPHLHSKIMASLLSKSDSDRLKGFRWAIATGGAVILLATVMILFHLADNGRTSIASQEAEFDKLIEGKETAESLVFTASGLSTKPLDAEISNLKADIEQAVDTCASLLNQDVLAANHGTGASI